MDPTQNTQPQPVNPPTPTKHKKKKTLLVSIILILVVAACILGFILVKKDKPSNNTANPSARTESANIDISTFIGEVRQKYIEELAKAGDLPGVSIGNSEEDTAVGKPTGYSFYVSSSTGAKGFRIIDNEGGTDYGPEGAEKRYSAYQKISAELASYMKDQGFISETIVIPGDPQQMDNYIYIKSNTVCNQNLNRFSCIESKILEDDAERLDPFIELVKDNPDLPNPVVASIYQDSLTRDGANGYKVASLFISPEKFNFYQTKSGEWKFVGSFGTQDIPECTEFGTDPEALKAFEGEDCYDSLPSGQQDITKLGQ